MTMSSVDSASTKPGQMSTRRHRRLAAGARRHRRHVPSRLRLAGDGRDGARHQLDLVAQLAVSSSRPRPISSISRASWRSVLRMWSRVASSSAAAPRRAGPGAGTSACWLGHDALQQSWLARRSGRSARRAARSSWSMRALERRARSSSPRPTSCCRPVEVLGRLLQQRLDVGRQRRPPPRRSAQRAVRHGEPGDAREPLLQLVVEARLRPGSPAGRGSPGPASRRGRTARR